MTPYPCSDTGIDADLAARIDALHALFAPLDRSDAPGAVVGISLHGRPLLRRGYGLASVQHGVAMQPGTRIRIASTSKHFTSLAVLLLAEDGRLDIDSPAERWLPGLPAPRGRPTLRDFMAHTSGLRCTLEMGTVANGYAPQPPDWQLKALLRQSQAHFAPGAGQLYCNGTYHALSEVVERVSGRPFEAFLKARILEPLGLHDTEAVRDDTLMVPGLAAPHLPDGRGGWRRPPADSELRGDGGMVSTVDDLLRWLALLTGRVPRGIGREATWHTLLQPAVLRNGHASTYALGLKRHAWRGVELLHHSGGLLGLNGQMLSVPAHGLDVVIIANGAPVSASALARRVVEIVLADQLTEPAPARPLAADYPHLIDQRFFGRDGLLFGFHDVDGTLALSLMHMAPAPVLYEQGDHVVALFEDIGLGPLAWRTADLHAVAGGGAQALLPMTISGAPETLQRLAAPRAATVQLAEPLLGRFRCDDLLAEAEVRLEGDEAVLRLRGDYSGWRGLRLRALSDRRFGAESASGDERYALEADIAGDARHAGGFWIDTYRARRLRFEPLP